MRQIPDTQVQRVLGSENPWWNDVDEALAEAERLRTRLFVSTFDELVRQRTFRRAVLLMGPRRVGKTVMIHHTIASLLRSGTAPAEIMFASVDHPVYNGRGLEDLVDLASGARAGAVPPFRYVFFDEIQYLRQWEVHLKTLVDRFPQVKFIASGSAAAALRLKSNESGAGRFTDFYLPPLTFHEYLDLTGEQALRDWHPAFDRSDADPLAALNTAFVRYVNVGGYPEVALVAEELVDHGRFVKSDIIDKVLLRDLPSLYGIQDVQELNHLFTTLAYNTGDEVSLDGLSKSSGVAKNTIRRYLEYLEAAFLIRRVYRVDRSARRFKRETVFKVHLTNPSMRGALFGPVADDDPLMGYLAETAYFAQWTDQRDQLVYARWGKDEVDVVGLGAAGQPVSAIELKWGDGVVRNPERDLRVLARFARQHGLPAAFCTTRSLVGEISVSGRRITLVPVAYLCRMIGEGQLTLRAKELLGQIAAEAGAAGNTLSGSESPHA